MSSNRVPILLSGCLLLHFKPGLKLRSVQRRLLVLITERPKAISPIAVKRPPNHWWEERWPLPGEFTLGSSMIVDETCHGLKIWLLLDEC